MKWFPLFLVVLFPAFFASGGIILNDDFSYSDGSIVGATGSPWNSHSGGGTNSEALVISGKLQLTSTRTEDINATLSGGPYTTGSGVTLYSSFTINFSALPTSASGEYFAHFNTSSHRARIYAGTTNAASGSFRLGVANTTTAVTQLPIDLNLHQNYFVVTRYNVATGSTTIWLNPVAETNLSVTASDAVGASTISTIAFRQAMGGGTLTIDNFKIGTAFNDVVSSNSVAAPVLVTQPQSQTVLEGFVVGFSVETSGSAPFNYQWRFNGTNLANATTSALSLTNVSIANAGEYVVVIGNNAGSVTSNPALLTVNPPPPAALSVLNYNAHGNNVEDWSTNSAQVRAIGRQVSYLNPDVVTFQEIPYTNTYQMTNFVKAFLPGYFLATNSVTDGAIRSVIASRFPITRSKSWLPHADLAPFGYTNSNFSRDLFEAEINVPNFDEPVHVFTTHLKAGASSSDDSAKRAAEASAISNFFVTSFLTTNAHRPYLLTGDLNEDIARPSTGSQQPIQRLANSATGLRLTTPLNTSNWSELTFSIQAAEMTKRYDYILPGGLLFSNIISSQIFRTDLLEPIPPQLQTNDSVVASDHLPVLMIFSNPYNPPFEIASVNLSNQFLTLNWQSVSGRQYRVESATILPNWNPFSATLTATGTNTTFSTNVTASEIFLRIYRFP